MPAFPDLLKCLTENDATNDTEIDCLHRYAEKNDKDVKRFASIQTGVASIGTLMSLILLVKAVRLRQNNAFFILLFTLIFVGLACTIVLMWMIKDAFDMLASSKYLDPYFKNSEYKAPLFASLIL
jgi:hypothetical protein